MLTSPPTCSSTARTSSIHLAVLSPFNTTPSPPTDDWGRAVSQLVLTNPRRPSDRVILRTTLFYVFCWCNKLQPSWRIHLGESYWLIVSLAHHQLCYPLWREHLQYDKLHFASSFGGRDVISCANWFNTWFVKSRIAQLLLTTLPSWLFNQSNRSSCPCQTYLWLNWSHRASSLMLGQVFSHHIHIINSV